MYIARNADDHVELTSLALFEIEDLILCAEDEGEADAECPAVMSDLRTIDASHEALHTEILGRNCVIGSRRGPAVHAHGAGGAKAPADRGFDRRRQQSTQERLRA